MTVEVRASAFVAAVALVRHTKVGQGNVLGHPLRRRLFRMLFRRPGLRLHDLWKALGVRRETARYHLFVLEKAGAIDSTKADGATRFFPKGTAEMDARAVLLRGRAMELASYVLANPGCRQGDIAARVGLTRKMLRVYADLMIQGGLIEENRRWRESRYFPTPRLRRLAPTVAARAADAEATRKEGAPNDAR